MNFITKVDVVAILGNAVEFSLTNGVLSTYGIATNKGNDNKASGDGDCVIVLWLFSVGCDFGLELVEPSIHCIGFFVEALGVSIEHFIDVE